MNRTGVFICHCGSNIASTVDIASVVAASAALPGVILAVDHKHICSEQGQRLIRESIERHGLDRVVIGACSPRLHEHTFQKLLADTSVNPYMLGIANLREQCAWVHNDNVEATAKAIDLVKMAVAKVARQAPLFPSSVPVHKKALVIGGGIAGIQAALDIAEAGYPVTIVEREPSLGGKMMLLDKTFPTMDCAACVCAPKIAESGRHPLITVLTGSELDSASGYVGNFQVSIRKKIGSTGTDRLIEDTFGAIVVATGYELIDWAACYAEYGGGRYENIITGLEFERLADASGPTGGRIVRPSDGQEPKEVVIVKCVGSRDPAKAKGYCSRACCMYAAKHAQQVLERIEGAACHIFYTDVRAAGKGYEEFYHRALSAGVNYIRGRVAKIYPEYGKLICKGEDTLLGRPVSVAADLVVLETAMIPARGIGELAAKLGLSRDSDGWLQEAHSKLRPVETHSSGIYVAGVCQGPKDIPDSVAQASAAAAKICGLFSKDFLAANPLVSQVDQDKCSGCGICVHICPYQAISMTELAERSVAEINAVLCQGCGACVAACRSSALDMAGFSNRQILEEVDSLWW